MNWQDKRDRVEILVGIFLVIIGAVAVFTILNQETTPRGVTPIKEIKKNFKNYSGKNVSVWAKKVEITATPTNYSQEPCIGSFPSPLFPQCSGLWVSNVSDETGEIEVVTAEKPENDSIIHGRFSSRCAFFPKAQHSCKVKDHSCECVVTHPFGENESTEADLMMRVIGDSVPANAL